MADYKLCIDCEQNDCDSCYEIDCDCNLQSHTLATALLVRRGLETGDSPVDVELGTLLFDDCKHQASFAVLVGNRTYRIIIEP